MQRRTQLGHMSASGQQRTPHSRPSVSKPILGADSRKLLASARCTCDVVIDVDHCSHLNPGATILQLPFIAVPFMGSMRRDHDKKLLQRLRKIDDDLRWLEELHAEWTDLDHMSEHAAVWACT